MIKMLDKFKSLGLMGVIEKVYMKLMRYEPSFNCAIRKIDDDQFLYNNFTSTPFVAMKYSPDYWCADPFLYDFGGSTYVYTEVYDRNKKIGHIGCSAITNGEISEPKPVIIEDYHLSFPMIFKFKEHVYMLPESEAGNCISLYECVKPPYDWRLVKKISFNRRIVDSVIYKVAGDDIYFLASEYMDEDPKLCRFITYVLHENEEGEFELNSVKYLSGDFTYESRNAGLINERLLCTQRSTPRIYGYSIKFSELIVDDENGESDRCELLEVTPEMLDIKFNTDKKIKGVHTYNKCNNYEIIDFEYFDSAIFRKIKNKIGRLK